ncbi:hypothetical protein [Leptolyngbya iicbica]|uniref:Uncharacterized protein n=2 Tax=Cyanophyceae TaxID=3028117 RepID=A0A4Q7E963_9CYAN|nr:hypothetical protein [Leptolyngbya sp. LK]RZM79108.1 hypothetical protein DYY88_10130 [Leptolyngbya sp. LK]
MDAKVLAASSAGFAIGVVATLLVGTLRMGGMMGRGGMMRGWGCSSLNQSVAPAGTTDSNTWRFLGSTRIDKT